jgi:hypothetical protein
VLSIYILYGPAVIYQFYRKHFAFIPSSLIYIVDFCVHFLPLLILYNIRPRTMIYILSYILLFNWYIMIARRKMKDIYISTIPISFYDNIIITALKLYEYYFLQYQD